MKCFVERYLRTRELYCEVHFRRRYLPLSWKCRMDLPSINWFPVCLKGLWVFEGLNGDRDGEGKKAKFANYFCETNRFAMFCVLRKTLYSRCVL